LLQLIDLFWGTGYTPATSAKAVYDDVRYLSVEAVKAMLHKYEPGKLLEALSAGVQQHIPEEQPSAHSSGTPAAAPLFTPGQNGSVSTTSVPSAWIQLPIPNEKDWVAEAVDSWTEKLKQEKEVRKDLELCQMQKKIEQLCKNIQHIQIDVSKLKPQAQSQELKKIPDIVQLMGVLMNRIDFLEDLTKKHENMLAQNEQLRAENKKQRQQLQTLLGRRAKRKVQVPKGSTGENS
jgi:hypothetical protein